MQNRLNLSRETALEWLVEQQLLEGRPKAQEAANQAGRNQRDRRETAPAKPERKTEEQTKPEQPSPAEPESKPPTAYQMWNQAQLIPIAGRPAAITQWLNTRCLWPADWALPSSLRWLPDRQTDDQHTDGEEQATGGRIVALLAEPEEWQRAWPGIPTATAIQTISIDPEGNQVPDQGRPGEAGAIKRTIGPSRGKLLLIGDPWLQNGTTANVAEGIADALALASRRPGPTVATLGAGALTDNKLRSWLTQRRGATAIYADQEPQGLAQAKRLHRLLLASGRQSVIRIPIPGTGDPAEAAQAAGWPEPRQEGAGTPARGGNEDTPRWEQERQQRLSRLKPTA